MLPSSLSSLNKELVLLAMKSPSWREQTPVQYNLFSSHPAHLCLSSEVSLCFVRSGCQSEQVSSCSSFVYNRVSPISWPTVSPLLPALPHLQPGITPLPAILLPLTPGTSHRMFLMLSFFSSKLIFASKYFNCVRMNGEEKCYLF